MTRSSALKRHLSCQPITLTSSVLRVTRLRVSRPWKIRTRSGPVPGERRLEVADGGGAQQRQPLGRGGVDRQVDERLVVGGAAVLGVQIEGCLLLRDVEKLRVHARLEIVHALQHARRRARAPGRARSPAASAGRRRAAARRTRRASCRPAPAAWARCRSPSAPRAAGSGRTSPSPGGSPRPDRSSRSTGPARSGPTRASAARRRPSRESSRAGRRRSGRPTSVQTTGLTSPWRASHEGRCASFSSAAATSPPSAGFVTWSK